jgi:hypothetical protein
VIARDDIPRAMARMMAEAFLAEVIDFLDLYGLAREHGLDWLGLAADLARLEVERKGAPGSVGRMAGMIFAACDPSPSLFPPEEDGG